MTELTYSIMNKEFIYRELFVKIEKEKKTTFATVTNDGYYVDYLQINSNTQEGFEKECQEYLKSERFQDKLKVQRGY